MFSLSMKEKPTSEIFVRIRRFNETYFVRCMEQDEVEVLTRQFMRVLDEINFTIPRMEEPLTVDDIRLTIKNRVSYPIHKLIFQTRSLT